VVTKIPRPHQVEEIQRGLIEVLRGGVRPAWLVHCHELLSLDQLGDLASDGNDMYARASALEDIIRDAISRLGDGPYGRAAGLLFGTASEARGLLLKVRRRLAAEEFDVLPSTFRKYYEDELLLDIAIEFWRITRQPYSS
jgi:hypothetical protein